MTWLRRVLGAMPTDEMAGITQREARWVLTSVPPDASRFLSALPLLVPADAFVFLEGGARPEQLTLLLHERRVEVSPRPALGTVWPRHEFFAVPAKPTVLAELARCAQALPYPEVCDHLHVFRGEEVLLSGYDAFAQPFTLSATIPEERVNAFSAAIGCSYRREVPEGAG
jgi:hypothetical protein